MTVNIITKGDQTILEIPVLPGKDTSLTANFGRQAGGNLLGPSNRMLSKAGLGEENVNSIGVSRRTDGSSHLLLTDEDSPRMIAVTLTRLTPEQADHLRDYLANNPREAQRLGRLYDDAMADGRITPRENALIHNDTEQMLSRAGVRADVTNVRALELVPIPVR